MIGLYSCCCWHASAAATAAGERMELARTVANAYWLVNTASRRH